ncbi:hypothetical protein CA54_46360 [Symmachiella macrocystis]|uniref:Uncharacterized protein n=1 Tax=Symmachiella macrocystis TaxID=2527985 RepID=A0A5C6BAX6_9PLAN|nr:hypothetical protein [Symmachiella macrocystis]TWU09395.1 hypothetical protein CA54_46360 [Symmachiella macrocystis]
MDKPRESATTIAGRLTTWLMLCVVALSVLMVAAAYIPSRLKLLGLYSIVLGLAAGWVIGQIARQCRMHYRRLLPPAALLMTIIALSGQIGESYRLWRNSERDRLDEQSQAALIFDNPAFGETPPPPDAFDDYLTLRFSPLAKSSWSLLQSAAKWPRLLLGLEVLLGGLAGALVAARLVNAPFCVTCESWHEPQRSVVLGSTVGNRCLPLLTDEEQPAIPEGGRLHLEYTSCRCSTAIPVIRCTREQPGEATRVVTTVQPDRETLAQLTTLLDGNDNAQ